MTATATPRTHDDFLPLLPGVEAHARLRFRGLSPADREESIADAVANAFAAFVRLKERGQDPSRLSAALSRYAALAVRCGRHVGRRLATRDALSWQAQRRHGFTVLRLGGPAAGGPGWWREAVAGSRASVARQAAFNLDFPAWLAALPARDRRVARLLAHGHSTGATARLVGVTVGRVSQLRRALAASWSQFHAGLRTATPAHVPIKSAPTAARLTRGTPDWAASTQRTP